MTVAAHTPRHCTPVFPTENRLFLLLLPRTGNTMTAVAAAAATEYTAYRSLTRNVAK